MARVAVTVSLWSHSTPLSWIRRSGSPHQEEGVARELFGVLAIDDDGAQLANHDVGVAVKPAIQTTSLFNVLTHCPGRSDDADGVLGVWHRTAGECPLLPRVRFPGRSV